jgi:hypothetical protein
MVAITSFLPGDIIRKLPEWLIRVAWVARVDFLRPESRRL